MSWLYRLTCYLFPWVRMHILRTAEPDISHIHVVVIKCLKPYVGTGHLSAVPIEAVGASISDRGIAQQWRDLVFLFRCHAEWERRYHEWGVYTRRVTTAYLVVLFAAVFFFVVSGVFHVL